MNTILMGKNPAWTFRSLKKMLDENVQRFNQPGFIKQDPVSIPHLFSHKQDIEIAGFFAAILAWGNRTSIIRSCEKLLEIMNHQPHQFVLNAAKKELVRCTGFVYRTFNETDLLYFLHFLQQHYRHNSSLETAFSKHMKPGDHNTENALSGFYDYFFSLPDYPIRTQKHIASPRKKSACKRLNMYLRWMVRQDDRGVDFGIWHQISPAQLVIPLDVHTARTARATGLLLRKQNDWQAALELTENLRGFNADDPVKYDFALFGISAGEKI